MNLFVARRIVMSIMVVLMSGVTLFSLGDNDIDEPQQQQQPQQQQPQQRKSLPEKLLIGYVSECDDDDDDGDGEDGLAQRAVREGVNVLIWSFWSISTTSTTTSTSTSTTGGDGEMMTMTMNASFNLTCVENMKQKFMKDPNFHDVIFLASTGGWNGGHLQQQQQQHRDDNSMMTPQQIYDAWKSWGGHVFDGFDFDLEGNDKMESPYNVFTIKCLQTMGEMSRLAHQDGYIVSIVPPQSYLDFGSSKFSRFVNLTHPTQAWHSEFSYYGANVYAYLLVEYGAYIDIIMIQLYESYSRALYEISEFKLSPSTYLTTWIAQHAAMGEQYYVQFEQDPSVTYKSQTVSVPLSKLVVGLANGWASGGRAKTLYIPPSECQKAYESWNQANILPRGFMFWTINLEGVNGIHMADGLNQFMNIRQQQPFSPSELSIPQVMH